MRLKRGDHILTTWIAILLTQQEVVMNVTSHEYQEGYNKMLKQETGTLVLLLKNLRKKTITSSSHEANVTKLKLCCTGRRDKKPYLLIGGINLRFQVFVPWLETFVLLKETLADSSCQLEISFFLFNQKEAGKRMTSIKTLTLMVVSVVGKYDTRKERKETSISSSNSRHPPQIDHDVVKQSSS